MKIFKIVGTDVLGGPRIHKKSALSFCRNTYVRSRDVAKIFHFVTDSRGRLSLQWYKSNIRFSTVNSHLSYQFTKKQKTLSNTRRGSDVDAVTQEFFFQITDIHFSEMENGSGKSCVHARKRFEKLCEIFHTSRAARSDDGDVYGA